MKKEELTQLNTRIPAELHRRIKAEAALIGIPLEQWAAEVLRSSVESPEALSALKLSIPEKPRQMPARPQDITRHSAISYWLALTGEAAKIATALAHSESTMRRHYMALVTKADGNKFAAL